MSDSFQLVLLEITVKPVLQATCIKQSTALRDHCSDISHITPVLK